MRIWSRAGKNGQKGVLPSVIIASLHDQGEGVYLVKEEDGKRKKVGRERENKSSLLPV